MNYKPYSQDFWTHCKSTLYELKSAGQPLVAAFDADGTLWDIDLGENFFNYQIDNNCVELPPDAFNHYLEMKKINGDPRPAYLWLAQINKGQSLDQVRKWSQQAFDDVKPMPIFSEQKKLIELFLENGVQVYIVTASITWAVEPGARALGLTNENVIGIETEVVNGLVTEKGKNPITYRQGKAEAVLARTKGVVPFFASGNTIGDFELLQSASHIRLAVSAASRDDKLFRSEFELQQLALENKWYTHRFI